MAAAPLTLLGRASSLTSRVASKGDASALIDMAEADTDIASRVASKKPICGMAKRPASVTMTPSLSQETSEESTSWETSPLSPLPRSEDGETDGESDEEESDKRLRSMRTHSGIGMPVWHSLEPVAVPPMMLPAVLPVMPTAESFVPVCASQYDGLVYDVHAYSPAPSPNGAWHGHSGVARNQRALRAQPPQQNRKQASNVDVARRADANQKCWETTICFRNLPNNYSTKMVLDLLDKNGFKNSYDFVYVPHDFKRLPTLVNVGYFFVNFVSHDVAVRALEKFTGFKNWAVLSSKVLAGAWAAKTQGKEACRERCKYFTFMHEDVPSECKPMMFDRGIPKVY